MSVKSNPKVALIGNPNSGKSSLFNQLTKLNQQVGNFPGVTVEHKIGSCKLDDYINAKIIDLPGIYSIYARSPEEKVAVDILTNPDNKLYPDILVFIADASNLHRNLLLLTQVKDLGVPLVMVLNMLDVAEQAGLELDIDQLRVELGLRIVPINARTGEGLDELKYVLTNPVRKEHEPYFDVEPLAGKIIRDVKEKFNVSSTYRAYQLIQQAENSSLLSDEDKAFIGKLKRKYHINGQDLQAKETIQRYERINATLKKVVTKSQKGGQSKVLTKLDALVSHGVLGYISYVGLLFVLFQLIFGLGRWPMLQLDKGFGWLSSSLAALLPDGWATSLLVEGILPALAGIFIFIPHLLLFYLFVALLEETGYMSRVMVLMDKFMRKFGLSGRSAIPLLSNAACAVPALLATKECSSWKDRAKSIFILPLVNCSTRLPIYIILIALLVPHNLVAGVVNLQGLVLLGMYFFSFVAAILSSWALKLLIKTRERDFFAMELPFFIKPYWKDIWKIVKNNIYSFSSHAVKAVIPVATILWILLNFSPKVESEEMILNPTEVRSALGLNIGDSVAGQDKKSETYAEHIGKLIEPVVEPLGFDWKIGLAVVSSFAAREVFASTLATIYSSEDDVAYSSLIGSIRSHIHANSIGGALGLATVLSILAFYAFAMQFFNVLGVLLRDGKSWWAPLLQLVYMTGLAYGASFVIYQIFS